MTRTRLALSLLLGISALGLTAVAGYQLYKATVTPQAAAPANSPSALMGAAMDASDATVSDTDVSAAAATVMLTRRPDLTLPDDHGLPRSLSEWDGKVIVLNFWATWCQPCQREIPMFIEQQAKLAAQGVQFIGVSFDDRQAVETFGQRTGIRFNYPILIGEDAAIDAAKQYGNDFGILPYTVIIDRRGMLRDQKFGQIDRDELEAALRGL
ncbi:MAG: TlpA family protein disulfide reductase [Gammaproteobacteria bacterium]|nr:TlpA family protein disulfide reductase [Gammaproteobacteria bacterium]